MLVLAICSIPTSLAFCFLSKSLSGKVKIINSLLGAEEAYNLEKLELGVRNLIEDRRETNEETLLFIKQGLSAVLLQVSTLTEIWFWMRRQKRRLMRKNLILLWR